MIRVICWSIFASLIVISPVHSDWVSLKGHVSQPAAPHVTLLQDDATATVLRIDVSGFEVRDVVAAGRTYTAVDLLTHAFMTEAGSPELPCVTKILAVPDRGDVSLEVVETGEEFTFLGYHVPPARISWMEGDTEPPYVESADVYRSAEVYPPRAASLDPPAVFRDFRIVRIAAYPVRYVAARNELRVASSLTIRLTYGSGDGVNPRTGARKPIAPSFAALYRSSIFNYQSILTREYGGMETGRDVLICIVPDAFANSLMPFANWRHKTGTFVKVTKFSEIGATATNPDIIKNYLAQVYNTWEYPPTYVLLAGDYGYVPIKQVTYDYTIVSENYFVEIEGNDFLPEMMIGRFTHESDVTEQNIVGKTVSYERTPFTANTAWFKKGVVASNNEYESAIVTKRFTRDRMMLDGGFTQVDTFMNHSPCYSTLSDLINTINNGRSFLNYRGEGWYTGWWASCYNFQTSNVSSINNGRMLTFVTSIGCGVGAFNQASCFGEAWLELGTVASPRGAVAFIGPTSNTHTAYNNKIDMGIYMGLFQEGLETAGQALERGRLFMYEVFGNQRWTEYQTHVYCILGDPSLHVWKNVPRPVAVIHPSSISVGYNQVSFKVTDSASGAPIAAAQVCLAGDSLYASAFTDYAGVAVLPITPPMIDTLTVLVRGGNVIPYEGTISVAANTEYVAPSEEPVVVDLDGNLDGLINPNEHGQIRFTLKNWGTQTALNVRATLSVDTSRVELQTAAPVEFGDIPGGATVAGAPFRFFVKPTSSVGDTLTFGLHVSSATGAWDYVYTLEVKGCRLKSVHYLVDDRAYPRPNARMDPGETVRLYLTLKNVGEDVAPDVRAVLRCSNPNITILDSLASFGTLPMDSSLTNYTDYFVVKVDSVCPPGYVMPFSLLLSTQSGLYAYRAVDTFSIRISVGRRGDPTGPDAYGYYAYASDDTMYRQAPRFNWIEISSIGTRVTIPSSGNVTATVSLPFTFRYYGTNYTQVRISSDGWIAFGSGTQTAPSAYCLPRSDNVNAMVAAFWDDLFFPTSVDTSQRLYYYHDAASQRFIVEWDRFGHNNTHIGRWNQEKFQIILSTSSPTVDGEILFQYKTVAYPVECTVGLEDHTQTTALQYICYDQPNDETVTPLRNSLALLFTTQSPQLLVGVDELREGDGEVPRGFALLQNYPNPFNPSTRIPFSVGGSSGSASPATWFVSLKVYDILGREVRTLVNENLQSGNYQVTFDAGTLASGVYIYRLTAGSFVAARKLIVLK